MATSPYAAKPTQLQDPVPGAEEQSEFDAFLASQPAPKMTPMPTPESEFDAAVSMPEEEPTMGLEDPNQMQSPMPAPEGIAALKEQTREAGARLKNAFAVTDRESIETLKKSGLFDDVQLGDNGRVQVKRKGRGGWEDFDREKFELIGDSIDWARDILEGTIENAFRVGGGISGAAVAVPSGAASGAVAGAPAGPLGAAAGAVTGGGLAATLGFTTGAAVGGAAGAVTAKQAGDAVAEKLFGIVPDPDRSKVQENATAMAFGAGFNVLSSKLARRQALKASQTREAKKTLDYARGKAEEAQQMINDVKESGIKLGQDGKFRLDPQQLVGGGGVPDLDVTAKEMSRNTAFQNFRRQIGQNISDAYDSVAKTIGSLSGREGELGKEFVINAQDIRTAEGKLIGSFRKLADQKLVDQSRQAPKTVKAVSDLLIELGGKVENVARKGGYENANWKVIAPDLGDVMKANPSLTKNQAKFLIQEVVQLNERLLRAGGNLPVDEVERLYTGFRGKIDASIGTANGKAYAMKLIDLKNAVRDDWTRMINEVLPDSQKGAYEKSLARYSEMMGATETLGKLLQTEDISRNALISNLFEGKNSLKMARGAKTLIQESNPGLWQDLTSEYIKKLRLDHIDPISGKTDWSAISKKWNGIGSEMQQEILEGSGIDKKAMDGLIGLGLRFQGADFGALPKATKRGVIRSLFGLLGPTMATTKGDAASNLLEGIGREESMMLWLKDGGLNEVLNTMPGLKPDMEQRLRGWISDWTPSAVKKAPSAVKALPGQVIKTKVRREVGEERKSD